MAKPRAKSSSKQAPAIERWPIIWRVVAPGCGSYDHDMVFLETSSEKEARQRFHGPALRRLAGAARAGPVRAAASRGSKESFAGPRCQCSKPRHVTSDRGSPLGGDLVTRSAKVVPIHRADPEKIWPGIAHVSPDGCSVVLRDAVRS